MKFYFTNFSKAKTIPDSYEKLSISIATPKKFNGSEFIPFIPTKSLMEYYYLDKDYFKKEYIEKVLGKFTVNQMIRSFTDAEIARPLFVSNGLEEDLFIRDIIKDWIESAGEETEII